MPELPEVETIKQTLAQYITGREIVEVTVNHPGSIKTPGISEFKEMIIGKRIINISRRGKYLVIKLSHEYILVIHLRMTGQLIYSEKSMPLKKHTHLIFGFDNGMELRFVDQRRFGCVWLVPENDIFQISGLHTLGVEPLSEDFTLSYLTGILKARKAKIKQVLLDQKSLAGIGNIYADEILFHSEIHPERTAASLTDTEINKLYGTIKNILNKAVKHRGTTFSDYVDGRGEKGSFQNYLKVYQRKGEKCSRCGTGIIRIKMGSRSAYYCPGCQR
ncbi:MAG: DNA-formamidopyrimidine glycosylase [Bacillota bacterium]|jgi:formamidopyrimidine-DNA glycosylase